MNRNQKTPQPPSPSTLAYIGATLALTPLLANAFAEQGSGLITDPIVAIGALAAAMGTLMAVAGGISAWLGLGRPCRDPRCRRPHRTIDCLNGKHDH